ncbi:unnamed protein product, partial [Mesorhabditis belari]|uniref:G-patch domain-containing protein n=1 Tax=Mesorhabditis belari TaxID=2138241 RepID=A0AAF3EFS2_9BILA
MCHGCTIKNDEHSVEAQNKGFKLLKALRWEEGKGLGKNKSGRVDPVAVLGKSNRAGPKCDARRSHQLKKMGVVREGGTKKQAKRKRAAARLQKRMKRGREVAVLRKSNRAGLGMRCKKKPSTKEGADGHVGLMDVIREGDTKKQENCSKVAKKNEARTGS